MGTILGNLLALVVIVIAALFGFVSLQISSAIFVALSYLVWALVMSADVFTKPGKSLPFCSLLSAKEVDIYRTYHIHFWAPGAAQAFSAFMNGLRIAGFVWGALCIWHGLYWFGGLSIFYFFLTGHLILKLNPWLYMQSSAQKGNSVAIEQLSLIQKVQEKRGLYNVTEET